MFRKGVGFFHKLHGGPMLILIILRVTPQPPPPPLMSHTAQTF